MITKMDNGEVNNSLPPSDINNGSGAQSGGGLPVSAENVNNITAKLLDTTPSKNFHEVDKRFRPSTGDLESIVTFVPNLLDNIVRHINKSKSKEVLLKGFAQLGEDINFKNNYHSVHLFGAQRGNVLKDESVEFAKSEKYTSLEEEMGGSEEAKAVGAFVSSIGEILEGKTPTLTDYKNLTDNPINLLNPKEKEFLVKTLNNNRMKGGITEEKLISQLDELLSPTIKVNKERLDAEKAQSDKAQQAAAAKKLETTSTIKQVEAIDDKTLAKIQPLVNNIKENVKNINKEMSMVEDEDKNWRLTKELGTLDVCLESEDYRMIKRANLLFSTYETDSLALKNQVDQLNKNCKELNNILFPEQKNSQFRK